MKISFRVTTATALAMGFITLRAFAQGTTATSAPAATAVAPVAETNAPAKPKVQTKGATKPAAKKPAAKAAAKSEPVLHPEPGAAKQNNVNVRGQATMNSEIVAHLKKGEPVTILEEVTIKKPKQDEPARWFRIALPPEVQVWVHSSFVDTNTATVKASKLNLRGGPGENFSVVGRLEKGAAVKPMDAKGEWLKIATPTNAFGFVAAHLLERTPGATLTAPPVEIVSAPPTTVNVPTNTAPVVAESPVVPLVAPVTPPVTPTPPITPPVVEPVTPPADLPIEKVRKVVNREGILRGSFSIQAPTYFELRSLDTGKTIDYVFSPSTNLVLKEFKGLHVIVTGEEVLDERWQHTPVIVVDALQAVP